MGRETLYSRSIALIGLPEFIRDLGGSPEKLFLQAGLNLADVYTGESFVSWNGVCKLFEFTASELDEPNFGLKWAYHLPDSYQNTGPMIFLATLVPTVRDFCELAIDYQKIHTNGVRYSYSEHPDEDLMKCHIGLHPLSVPCRQYSEHILATCMLMEAHYLKVVRPKKIMFQHSEPTDLTWHKKIFNCPFEFNADVYGAHIDDGFLDEKMDGRLKLLQPILKLHLNRQLKKEPTYHSSILQLVQELLPAILGVRNSGIGRVADIMQVSPKKLQRLLKEEGVTYSEVIDTVRYSMSERLLFESDIPISRISRLLDYTTPEAFNAACKRWTGMSPRKYRLHLRLPKQRAV